MTRIFHRFLCERWIPCQASTAVLCLHYRPVTVHCSTKDVYTFEITFLALYPWNRLSLCLVKRGMCITPLGFCLRFIVNRKTLNFERTTSNVLSVLLLKYAIGELGLVLGQIYFHKKF